MRRATLILAPTVGALLCAAITLSPDFLPRLIGKAGYAWTPFNSSNYRVGDTYYYAPWVREMIAAEWPLQPPTNINDHPNLTIETVRAVPYVLAAIAGLLFKDFRNVLLANEAQSAVLFFFGFYLIAHLLLQRPWPSFAAAVLAYYYSGLWQAILPNAQFMRVFGNAPFAEGYLRLSIAGLRGMLSQLADPVEYDYLGSAFRYMHLSISGPLLIFHALDAMLLYLKFSWPRTIALFVLSLALAFSYPTHPLVGYVAMIILCGLTLLERRWREFFALAITGLSVLAILLVSGVPEMVRETMRNSIFLEQIHLREPVRIGTITWHTVVDVMLVNKYLISAVLLAALFRCNPKRRLMVVGIGVTAYLASFVTFLEPASLWPRLLERGVDILWVGFIAAGLVRIALVTGRTATRGLGRRAVTAFGVAAVVAVCLVPTVGFSRFAWRNAVDNLTRFIPADRWSAYEWICSNLPRRTTLATLNWDDLAFLAVYSNVNLATGYSDLSGRTPEVQLRNFVGIWKMLGLSRDELGRLVTHSIPAMMNRKLGNLRHPPINSPDDYASSELAAGLFYWPYLPNIGNIRIATDDMKTNPALVAYVNQIFDQILPDEIRQQLKIEYLLLDPATALSTTLPPGSQLVFQNAARSVYRLPSNKERTSITR
jgi:hypothetical protein